MSHAIDYLRDILSPAQLAAWEEKRRLDTQDSTARRQWRFFRQDCAAQRRHPNALLTPKIQARRVWLRERGYIDDADRWTNKTFQ